MGNQPHLFGAQTTAVGTNQPRRRCSHGLGSVTGRAVTLISTLLLTGCVGSQTPANLESSLYSREKTNLNGNKRPERRLSNRNVCPKAGTAAYIMPSGGGRKSRSRLRVPPMRYSPGDRFNIIMVDAPEISGDYAVNLDGRVILPFAGQVSATGLTNEQLARTISDAFVNRGIFSRRAAQVSVRPIQWAPVNVTVSGAVFFPGRHLINFVREADRPDKIIAKSGDSPANRRIPAALQAAGGVRPDADLTNVRVSRNGKMYRLDWRGAFTGEAVDDLPLIEGDHVEVGEAECFQSELVRPSQITPNGVKLIISNLTAPALNNAATVQNQNSSGGVPYGTRLLQGLVQANCIGGNYATNARRYAVLISRNPKTKKTEVVQLPVEDLVRRSDRDSFNPFLMPDDSIACYDSAVSELRDVMSIFTSASAPFSSKF